MRPIFIVASNTFREIIRDRVLYGILIFALLLFGLSIALGQLSFAEQSRIAANFGFAAIQMSAVVLSIFVGSTLVGREIDKKTILTLLVRPITRTQFLIGKTIGLLMVIAVSIALLSTALGIILTFAGYPPNLVFMVALHGIILEAMVLLAFTLFFGSFASPMLSVSFVIGIFLIGHWVASLKFFIDKSSNDLFRIMGEFMIAVMPNLEVFNWRGLFVYADVAPLKPFLWANVYTAAWMLFLVTLSAAILSRRDLG